MGKPLKSQCAKDCFEKAMQHGFEKVAADSTACFVPYKGKRMSSADCCDKVRAGPCDAAGNVCGVCGLLNTPPPHSHTICAPSAACSAAQYDVGSTAPFIHSFTLLACLLLCAGGAAVWQAGPLGTL